MKRRNKSFSRKVKNNHNSFSSKKEKKRKKVKKRKSEKSEKKEKKEILQKKEKKVNSIFRSPPMKENQRNKFVFFFFLGKILTKRKISKLFWRRT